MMGALLVDKQLTVTAYHLQTNGKAARFNKSILVHLQRFVGEHQKHQNTFLQALMYAYNTRKQRTTSQIPFSFVFAHYTPSPIFRQFDDVVPDRGHGKSFPQIFSSGLKALIRTLWAKIDAHSRKSQQRFKHEYDRHVGEISINKPGEYIYNNRLPLVARNDQHAHQIASSVYHKLLPRSTKPFCIIRVQSKSITVDKHGIETTANIKRFVYTPSLRRNPPT